MTKVSVFGEKPTEEKKPIEFKLFLHQSIGGNVAASKATSDFDCVELFRKGEVYDTILAWNEDNSGNIAKGSERVYLGHWNDGVV